MRRSNMTRCLNCGADRDVDVCEACGLGSSAAELSLRSTLLNRTAFFLLGAIAFIAASVRYPALDLDEILIFIGVLFFLTLGIGIWVERRALRHAEVEALKRVYYGLIPLPWLLAVLLLGNGWLDHSPSRNFKLHTWWGSSQCAGRSRAGASSSTHGETDHRFEHVPVDQGDFDRFTTGDVVEVQVKGRARWNSLGLRRVTPLI